MKKHYKSVFENEQELLKALIDLHLDGKDIECDPMYFKGNFYKDGVNRPKYYCDRNPQVSDCIQGNSLEIAKTFGIEYGTLNSIILDPPFMIGNRPSQKKYYSSMTHTIYKDLNELYNAYAGMLLEAKSCLKKGGIIIFKCQDYTDSKTTMTHCLVWELAEKLKLYPKDLAILVKPNKITNPLTKQRHLRKIHTYFWVFQRTK